MASSVNKVILVGNLGGDPEMRTTASGLTIARFSLATTTYRSGKSDTTEWHSVVFFGKIAETIEKYLRKGSKVYVEGRIEYSTWTDKEGNKRTSTDIIGNEVQFLDPPPSRGGGDRSSSYDRNDRDDSHSRSNSDDGGGSSRGFSSDYNDDDLPF